MRLFVLRHESRTKDATFFSPLTKIGLENSNELKIILKKLKIDLVFSSPYIRTLQTIFPFTKSNNLKVNIDNSLGEAIKPFIIPENSYKIELPNYIKKELNVNLDYKSILEIKDLKWDENINDIKNRIKKFLKYIFTTYGNKNKNILICSHQTPINCILNIVNKNKFDYKFPYPTGKLSLVFNIDKWKFLPVNWNIDK